MEPTGEWIAFWPIVLSGVEAIAWFERFSGGVCSGVEPRLLRCIGGGDGESKIDGLGSMTSSSRSSIDLWRWRFCRCLAGPFDVPGWFTNCELLLPLWRWLAFLFAPVLCS